MVSNRYLDISIDYLGSIPADKLMLDAIRKQKVIVEMFPSSRISIAFNELAARICSEHPPSLPKGNIQFFWKKLLNFGSRK